LTLKVFPPYSIAVTSSVIWRQTRRIPGRALGPTSESFGGISLGNPTVVVQSGGNISDLFADITGCPSYAKSYQLPVKAIVQSEEGMLVLIAAEFLVQLTPAPFSGAVVEPISAPIKAEEEVLWDAESIDVSAYFQRQG
jgi:hypothetical protein